MVSPRHAPEHVRTDLRRPVQEFLHDARALAFGAGGEVRFVRLLQVFVERRAVALRHFGELHLLMNSMTVAAPRQTCCL